MSDTNADMSGGENNTAGDVAANNTTISPAPEITFSEREEKLLKIAWHCLKGGPPDVDMAKLTELGDFKTQKTCANTWGVIKKKLAAAAPAADGTVAATVTTTPKTKATPKKRAKKAEEGDADGSPVKKARTPKKSAAKVKAEADAEGDGNEE